MPFPRLPHSPPGPGGGPRHLHAHMRRRTGRKPRLPQEAPGPVPRDRRAPAAGSGAERLSLRKGGGHSDPVTYLSKSSPQAAPQASPGGNRREPEDARPLPAPVGPTQAQRFPRLGERISRRPRPRLQGDAACVRDAAPGIREFAQPQCVGRHAPLWQPRAVGRTWVD